MGFGKNDDFRSDMLSKFRKCKLINKIQRNGLLYI